MKKYCIICNSKNNEKIYKTKNKVHIKYCDFSVCGKAGDFGEITKCKKCGLIWQLYNKEWGEIEKKYKNMNIEFYISEKTSRAHTAKKDAFEVQRFIKKGKILDIGCSAGIFLKALPDKFLKFGVEPGKKSATEASITNPNANIKNTFVENVRFKEQFFDCVTLWDCIEHFKDPDKAIKIIKSWLKPGGKIFICTPNIESMAAKSLGKKWPHLIRQHSFYFSPKTLSALLLKNKIKVIKIKTYTRWFTASYLFKRIFGISINSFFLKSLCNIKIPVNLGDTFLCVGEKND